MIWLAWIISLVCVFYLGFYLKDLRENINSIKTMIKEKPKPTPLARKSYVIDPDDVQQKAKYEHDQLMKKLNPDEM